MIKYIIAHCKHEGCYDFSCYEDNTNKMRITSIKINPPKIYMFEKKIQGSMMGSNRFRVDMPRFVDFYLQGKLHLDELVSNRIGLEDINEGMAALNTGEIARSVIMFD
mgnify:CR=1 FL=1